MKRIAYAVMGEGRGHVMRLITILPHLQAEALIFAGGDAYRFLIDHPIPGCSYQLVEIPTLKYAYGEGRIRLFTSFRRNLRLVLDFKMHALPVTKANFSDHPVTKLIEDKVSAFRPDIIVSDSEFFIQHIRREVPLVLFDRFAKIAFCKRKVEVPLTAQINRKLNILGYKYMMGHPDQVIATSFYDSPPKKKYEGWVHAVGPILKPEVMQATASDGDHVVVYATHKYILTNEFQLKLKNIDREVRIYGAGRTGVDGNLVFLKIEPERFVQDLAASAYVITTPGNVLLSEINYFQKKAVMFWTKTVEQQENALYAQKIQLGYILKDLQSWEPKQLEEEVGKLEPSEIMKDSTMEVVGLIKSFIP